MKKTVFLCYLSIVILFSSLSVQANQSVCTKLKNDFFDFLVFITDMKEIEPDREFWQKFEVKKMAETALALKCDYHSNWYKPDFSYSKKDGEVTIHFKFWETRTYLAKLNYALDIFFEMFDFSEKEKERFLSTGQYNLQANLHYRWKSEVVTIFEKNRSILMYRPFLFDPFVPFIPYMLGPPGRDYSQYEADGACVRLVGHGSEAIEFTTTENEGKTKMVVLNSSGEIVKPRFGVGLPIAKFLRCSLP